MLRIVPENLEIDFLGARKKTGIVSIAFVLISLVLAFTVGPKYGIDFKGGVEIQVKLLNSPDINTLRAAAANSGIGTFEIQSYGDEGNQFLLRVKQPEGMPIEQIVRKIDTALETEFTKEGFIVERQDFVGPKAGAELREKGMYAVLFALIGILLYVSLRFEFSFALGAVAALFHDVLIVSGIFIVIGHEFNLQIVAALLTIVGYSLNDTIVVFDRIRENIGRRSKSNLVRVMNMSVNEMMSRTILTSLTTLFTASSLYFLSANGSVIKDFALAMMLGILVGTYSSIFVASPVLLMYENYQKNKQKS